MKKRTKSIIKGIIRTIGYTLYLIYLWKLDDISTTAWLYGFCASAGVILIMATLLFKD